jgi:dolichol kinase
VYRYYTPGTRERTRNVLAETASQHMSSRNVGAVTLVIVLGLVIGVLGLVEPDLYAVGVLILTLGGVGAAALAGEYLIRFLRAHLRSHD